MNDVTEQLYCANHARIIKLYSVLGPSSINRGGEISAVTKTFIRDRQYGKGDCARSEY